MKKLTKYNTYLEYQSDLSGGLIPIYNVSYILDTDEVLYDPAGCTSTVYHNVVQSQTFVKNNCGPGFIGSTETITVPAGTFQSIVSQTDANQKAIDWLAANGQDETNTQGSCTAIPTLRFETQNGPSAPVLLDYTASPPQFFTGIVPNVGTNFMPRLTGTFTGTNPAPIPNISVGDTITMPSGATMTGYYTHHNAPINNLSFVGWVIYNDEYFDYIRGFVNFDPDWDEVTLYQPSTLKSYTVYKPGDVITLTPSMLSTGNSEVPAGSMRLASVWNYIWQPVRVRFELVEKYRAAIMAPCGSGGSPIIWDAFGDIPNDVYGTVNESIIIPPNPPGIIYATNGDTNAEFVGWVVDNEYDYSSAGSPPARIQMCSSWDPDVDPWFAAPANRLYRAGDTFTLTPDLKHGVSSGTDTANRGITNINEVRLIAVFKVV